MKKVLLSFYFKEEMMIDDITKRIIFFGTQCILKFQSAHAHSVIRNTEQWIRTPAIAKAKDWMNGKYCGLDNTKEFDSKLFFFQSSSYYFFISILFLDCLFVRICSTAMKSIPMMHIRYLFSKNFMICTLFFVTHFRLRSDKSVQEQSIEYSSCIDLRKHTQVERYGPFI